MRGMRSFSKILIANRGEIACRIARTAHAMGYRTVAVYSDADETALHVASANEAVRIGPAPVGESYLDVAAILAAAKVAGADAVHPGYGFLSENAAFAAACVAAGLVFVGPPASAIAAMGNKAAAKRRMIEAGVPCVPGYQGADQTDATLIAEAKRIGLPVMVKAAAGGGGRGMRLVREVAELAAAIRAARSEASHAFGSGELILEKAVVDARHIEIQVFADDHGNVIHLGERDCSVQRRHQKVIEEAPSPAVSAALRAEMGAAAVQAAEAIGYRGAGTVEFLLGADGAFYFLEMNTRLQVEHPVTEAITGLDLVEWQLRVARGEALPLRQEQVRFAGHAIEVRLYAEDPTQGFLPQSGEILAWRPPSGAGVRVDHGLKPRDRVSAFYDPMIAKVIAHGETREVARARLIKALGETSLLGTTSNRGFLVDMLEHPVFAAGQATTAFIEANFAAGSAAMTSAKPGLREVALAAALLLEASGELPEGSLAGWSSTGVARYPVMLVHDQETTKVWVGIPASDRFDVTIGDVTVAVHLRAGSVGARRVVIDGASQSVRAVVAGGTLFLDTTTRSLSFRDGLREAKSVAAGEAASRLLAPMNGRVVKVLAKVGENVRAGQCIVVLEAMKMQHEITASRAGALAGVHVAEGQQVATRFLLAELAAE
jgi:geranyl-CoA carboxylase alpha subunit